MLHLNRLWPPNTARHLGGGGGAGAIQSAPVPTPAPPVTADNPASIQAEHDMAQSNMLKRSVKKTILAGDTGGFQAGGPNVAGQAATGFRKLG